LAGKPKDFEEEKKRLRMLYKNYKAGIIPEEKISKADKELLVKYYGVKAS